MFSRIASLKKGGACVAWFSGRMGGAGGRKFSAPTGFLIWVVGEWVGVGVGVGVGGWGRWVGWFVGGGVEPFFVGLVRGGGFAELCIEGEVVQFVLQVFLGFLAGVVDKAVRAELLEEEICIVYAAAVLHVVLHVGHDLVCEGFIATAEALEKEVEHLHALIDGAAVLEFFDGGGELVDGIGMEVGLGNDIGAGGEDLGGVLVYDVVTLLCDERRHVAGGEAEPVPVALLTPKHNGAAVDAYLLSDLGFGEEGLEEEFFSLFLLFVFHI